MKMLDCTQTFTSSNIILVEEMQNNIHSGIKWVLANGNKSLKSLSNTKR